jgi:hypothetical protein
VDALVQLAASGAFEFRYVLRAQMERLRIPPQAAAERTDGLWRHTCFEAFVRAPGAASYYELNFAPSGQWAAYRFDAYREGMSRAELDAPPQISVGRFDARLELTAAARLRDGDPLRAATRLQFALSAVVEDVTGALSYWALKHGPGKPDFHDPDVFVLALAR